MYEVKLIAAIDDKRGIAKEQKIPWHLPTDQQYFKAKLATGPVVMGYNTYISNGRKPYGSFENTVFNPQEMQAENVTVLHNANVYFAQLHEDIWVAGGGQIFALALPFATKLYLTHVQGDFGCDVYFPAFENKFVLETDSDWQTENGVTFRFETWVPKA